MRSDFSSNYIVFVLKKNLNASRPFEQTPVREKNVITFRWNSGAPAQRFM